MSSTCRCVRHSSDFSYREAGIGSYRLFHLFFFFRCSYPTHPTASLQPLQCVFVLKMMHNTHNYRIVKASFSELLIKSLSHNITRKWTKIILEDSRSLFYRKIHRTCLNYSCLQNQMKASACVHTDGACWQRSVVFCTILKCFCTFLEVYDPKNLEYLF